MPTFQDELAKGSSVLLEFMSRFPDGIMILNLKGHVLYLNSASERLLGRPRSEWLGKRWQYILTEGDVREIDMVHPNGQKVTLQIHANQMTWAEEQSIFLLVLRDVTRIKQVTQLQKKLERLEELDQRKNDFVSIVSHELRTPLAISLEGINLMNDGIIGKINEKQRSVLKTSKDNLDRLKKIIDNLLDISKIESGRMELNLGFVNANELVKSLVSAYQNVIASKKLSLKARLPREEILLCLDRDKIIQVLTNLLHNATKFTPKGGKIEVILSVTKKEVTFQVKDSGIGMAKDDVKKVFNKFQQVGFGREREKGTGLGLFIAKALVELHKGSIDLKSQLGKGTTFSIHLPQLDVLQHIYDQELNELLKQMDISKKPLSLIVIQLEQEGTKDVKPKESPQEFNIFFEILSQMFSRMGDKVLYYKPDLIYIYLPDTNRMSALSLIYQIKEKMVTIRLKEKFDRINAKPHFGLSVFPFDSKDSAGLVQNALTYMDRIREVVIIDDDMTVKNLLTQHLDTSDHRLSFTSNGKEALTIIQEHRPDLIILNVMLPNINGYELIGRLKEDQNISSIPVVLLTTRDTDVVQRESVRFGEIPLFNKSGDLNNLVTLVKKLI